MVRTVERTTASRLGSYEILHKLATGGMAELFLARSVGLENFEKLVVLKRILPTLAENDKFVRLFLDEARLAAGLDHPCIAHVYDLGKVDGGYFFTMEYVHGRDIRSVLNHSIAAGAPWPIEHAMQVASSIAAALQYAHEHCGPNGQPLGIVHRDVSPSNIMVTYEGAVKLLDFGVAKIATSTTKTRTGSLKGKVAYMSPEQAKGAEIDRRSDIFSLGTVLWEMLTMKRLFKADNDLATLQLIIHQPPVAPSQLRADCPPELDKIVLRALAADPTNRYQTAQELQLDIENLARDRRLNQSSIALAGNMSALFEHEIEAWKRARAIGVSLADHIIAWSAEAEPTPTTEFVDDDAAISSAGRHVEADNEKTEQTKPPVVVTAPVAAAPAKRKKKRIKDYAIVKEPSVVIEPELAAAMDSPVAPVAAPASPPVASVPVAIARAPVAIAPPPLAPVPVAIAHAPVAIAPPPVAPVAAPVLVPPPAVAVAAREQEIPVASKRPRVAIGLGLAGAAAAAAIAFALVTHTSASDPPASESPSSTSASPSSTSASPSSTSEPPSSTSESPSPPSPSPSPAPTSSPSIAESAAPAVTHPVRPARPRHQASHVPVVKAASPVAPARHPAAARTEHVEPTAPKTTPKFDPNAALPPM